FSEEQRRDPEQFRAQVRQEHLSVVEVVPSFLRALLDEAEAETDWAAGLRWMVVTGEAFPTDLALRWQRRYPAVRLLNAYGPTECADDVTQYEPGLEDRQRRTEESVPIGQALANTRLYVLDRWGMQVGVGMMGELYVGGKGVGRGYIGEAVRSAESFVPDPFGGEAGGRLYRTGDLVKYVGDGALEFVGRVDRQVKVRGYRIELGEIEGILGQHEAVKEFVVVVDKKAEQLRAYLVLASEAQQAQMRVNDWRAYLAERLPEYMVPARFVVMASLPLTANGKIDRRHLEDLQDEREETGRIDEPRGAIEEAVAEIWVTLLGRKKIGRHESFFALGGHSLLATQVIARIRSLFGLDMPLRSLFEKPTIAGLGQLVSEALEGKYQTQRPALIPVSREQDLPLSFAQQRLWLLDQIEPGSSAYNIPEALRLRGPLRKEILEKSFREVLRRHEALRTTFKARQEQAIQVINAWEDFIIHYEDWRELSIQEREIRVQKVIVEEAARPFDLVQGPLLRVTLLCLDAQEHVLLLTMHHIIADGWSMGLLQQEIIALYPAFQQGLPSPLSEPELQYADYAIWQRSWLQGEVFEQHLGYWKDQLRDLAPLDLPIDYSRPARQTFKGALQTTVLPTALVEDLRLLCQREGTTLFMLLLAAYQILLARYSGQEDIAVGTPIASRTHTEVENLIGCFINTLVLRTDVSGNPSFREVLASVREVCLGAYAHQEIPFERLVEELQPERDLSRSPLFQVMLMLQNLPVVDDTFVGLTASPFEREYVAARYEITLSLVEVEQGLLCELAYCTDLFAARTMKRLLEHWQRLLAGIVANPDACLADLPLLTEAEMQHMLLLNNTAREYPQDLCLPQLFEAQVAHTPQAQAVSCGEEHLTYWELNEMANRLAWLLLERGVGPEVPVALCADRGVHFIAAVLAVWKAGGIHVPVDPNYPESRIAQLVKRSGCSLVLTNARLQTQLEHILLDAGDAGGDIPPVLAIDTLLKQGTNITNLPARCEWQNLAYIIYTSGSTGVPKGVMVEHGGMLNHIYGKITDLQITQEDILIQNGPPCFDIIIWQCFAALLVGGRVQVFSDEIAFDPTRLLEQTELCRASILQLVPSMLREIIHEVDMRGKRRPQLTCLRWIVPTGDALPTELCQHWLERYPAIPLLNTYGSTECSDDQCHYTIRQITFEAGAVPVAPIGYPIGNMQAYVLDQRMSLVPAGVVGELYIGGVGVGRGYLHDPIRTAEMFLPDPFSTHPGGRLYKTRDQVRSMTEGEIEFLGRVDHLV
ncbi:MAG TPA: amino acid adenylation domain-containing protein, partial [Ktedonobacteraceae bacterium]|nr:amino acid adenylation domain-containing protein [Ktedonobacteraceae bacterium]